MAPPSEIYYAQLVEGESMRTVRAGLREVVETPSVSISGNVFT